MPSSPTLLAALTDRLGAAHVLTAPEDLEPYLVETRGLHRGRALAVARPTDTAQAAFVVARCAAAGVPVVAQGGNTGLVGGGVPQGGIVLSLARLGRPSEPPTEVDLAALVDAVVDDFRDLGEPVTLEESERIRVRLRPALMRRAVRNLIENAVKYGEAAHVRLVASAGSIAIEVADRGPGIPPDRLADVFDPFTRLEHSRNRETGGIGLGLALAEAIVRDAGGQVTLANRSEGGLAATITLPR